MQRRIDFMCRSKADLDQKHGLPEIGPESPLLTSFVGLFTKRCASMKGEINCSVHFNTAAVQHATVVAWGRFPQNRFGLKPRQTLLEPVVDLSDTMRPPPAPIDIQTLIC